jgi:glycosyltransferase involved in cell wall biosynthesis
MSHKKILWLCSWYPSKVMPFNGDFIKRHAEAVSLYEDICVIHVVRDVKGTVTKDVFIEESENKRLNERIIYYYTPSYRVSLIDKYFSEFKYRKLYKQAVNNYMKTSGGPDLAHVHVGMKAGIIAWWLKNKKSVPYVISEHWSGILPESEENVMDQPVYIRTLWKKVVAGAKAISAVSTHLAESLKKQFDIKEVTVIPNVVDTTIFYPAAARSNDIRFIHISGLEKLKNPKAIIQAFVNVINIYPSAVLDIFGPFNKQLIDFVSELEIEENIYFHNEIPQTQLAEFVRQSIALVLYSSYETFGCVIIEANACGIPVLVSDIPVFHETVQEGMNGSFVKLNDPNALAERMIELIMNRSSFNDNEIVSGSSKYSYEKVGKLFSDWYNDVLSKKV